MKNEDLKIKLAYCPECGNAITVAAANMMSKNDTAKFMKEAAKDNLDVKTITLSEWKKGDIKMFCENTCKNYVK